MEVKTAPRLPERAAAARKAEPVKASVRRGSGVRLTFIASTIPPPASGYDEEGERSSSAAAPVNNSPVEVNVERAETLGRGATCRTRCGTMWWRCQAS